MSYWKELLLLTQVGLSPVEVLRAATSGNARILGVESEVGRIAPGYYADFVLIEGNPHCHQRISREEGARS